MRNFRRSIWFSWPYRRRLATSIACALVVASLWSVNLGAIYPVLKLLRTQKNLQQWVDEEIAQHEAKRDEQAAKVESLTRLLQQVDKKPDTVEREKERRGYSAALAAATEE